MRLRIVDGNGCPSKRSLVVVFVILVRTTSAPLSFTTLFMQMTSFTQNFHYHYVPFVCRVDVRMAACVCVYSRGCVCVCVSDSWTCTMRTSYIFYCNYSSTARSSSASFDVSPWLWSGSAVKTGFRINILTTNLSRVSTRDKYEIRDSQITRATRITEA